MKRDKQRVLKALTLKGDKYIANEPLTVVLPKRFTDEPMGAIEEEVKGLGFFAIVTKDGAYAVNKLVATVGFSPKSIDIRSLPRTGTFEAINDPKNEGDKYLVMSFDKGDTVITNNNVVAAAPLVFNVFNEMIATGKHPFFFEIQDFATLLDTAITHAFMDYGADPAVVELLSAIRMRVVGNYTHYARYEIKTKPDFRKINFVFSGMKRWRFCL